MPRPSRSSRAAAARKFARAVLGREPVETRVSIAPMTDVVFLLLIFFALTLNFIVPSFDLNAALPKDRGPKDGEAPFDERTVHISLEWQGEPRSGRCIARTFNYKVEGQKTRRHYTFGVKQPGEEPLYPTSKRVDYPCPDFFEITDYLEQRRALYRQFGEDIRLNLRFDDAVPVQMVADILSLAGVLGIAEVQFQAELD